MGMFDYVNFKMNCPKCGDEVLGFQSKDAHCMLEKVDPVSVNNFYSNCACGHWIELSRNDLPKSNKPRRSPYTIDEVLAMGFKINEDESSEQR